MAWQTPKTNWTSSDVVGPNDMNRIEGNINLVGTDLSTHLADTTPHSQYVPQLGANNQIVNLFKALNQQIDTRSVTLSYDTAGNLTTITEKDGATTVKTTTLTYSNGRLSTVTEQVAGKTITITLTYDTSGYLTGVTRSVV